MPANHSPWLAQLNRERPVYPLGENRSSDIAIVGAGIAGIATAYFTLLNTDKKIILIEGGRVAHGATGHNAGQIVSYFERQISDLVNEFGLEKTAKAQDAIDSAWGLLDGIYKKAKLQTPFAQFTGYAGCQDLSEITVHLENNYYSKAANINSEQLMVSAESGITSQISKKYDGLYSVVPQADIMSLLETNNPEYIACVSARKGVMNSALFCEELLDYMFRNYADRLTLFEESHVKEIELYKDYAILKVLNFEIKAEKVVLCTNGFEKFKIVNTAGEDINSNFHHLVNGAVGYMAAYLEEHTRSPIAISYLPNKEKAAKGFDDNPYFYLTRRTFELEKNKVHSLICIGGPEIRMEDTDNYIPHEHLYPENAQAVVDKFLHGNYKFAPENINYEYKWHGLMGYTPNGVRLIGPEPINPVLLYNLGCNGIGILPSIYGGKKISRFLNNEELEESIFDPKDSRIN